MNIISIIAYLKKIAITCTNSAPLTSSSFIIQQKSSSSFPAPFMATNFQINQNSQRQKEIQNISVGGRIESQLPQRMDPYNNNQYGPSFGSQQPQQHQTGTTTTTTSTGIFQGPLYPFHTGEPQIHHHHHYQQQQQQQALMDGRHRQSSNVSSSNNSNNSVGGSVSSFSTASFSTGPFIRAPFARSQVAPMTTTHSTQQPLQHPSLSSPQQQQQQQQQKQQQPHHPPSTFPSSSQMTVVRDHFFSPRLISHSPSPSSSSSPPPRSSLAKTTNVATHNSAAVVSSLSSPTSSSLPYGIVMSTTAAVQQQQQQQQVPPPWFRPLTSTGSVVYPGMAPAEREGSLSPHHFQFITSSSQQQQQQQQQRQQQQHALQQSCLPGRQQQQQQHSSPTRIRSRPPSTGSCASTGNSIDSSRSYDEHSSSSTTNNNNNKGKSSSRFSIRSSFIPNWISHAKFGKEQQSSGGGSSDVVRRDTPTPPDLVVENDDSGDEQVYLKKDQEQQQHVVNIESDNNNIDNHGSSNNNPTINTNNDANNDNDDNKSSSRSPLPQNLRGDPFRSAKVKTEMCRNFGRPEGCPFGDKCNYAHGEHELKYTKLIDLERAGLIDVEIFRTHACSCWVATGACPFDQRCTGIHDPRVAGLPSNPNWLPHAETLVNSVGPAGHNVDKLFHERLACVYSCSPLYGYVPPERWVDKTDATLRAWNDLYGFVCNLKRRCVFSWSKYEEQFGYGDDDGGNPEDDNNKNKGEREENRLTRELYRVMIALKMRERKLGQCYAYLPSHLLSGELCMVLQNRTFRIDDDKNSANAPRLIEVTTANDATNNNPKGSSSSSSDNVSVSQQAAATTANKDDGKNSTLIEAQEIAFGPVGDPGVQQVSVWFDLSSTDIVACTPQQAKRHKRSRHRLKKNRYQAGSTATKTSSSQTAKTNTTTTSTSTDNNNSLAPFYNYQPIDDAAFHLITNILQHRADVLSLLLVRRRCRRRRSNTTTTNNNISKMNDCHILESSLRNTERHMLSSFESQRRFWTTWSWPVCVGRGSLTEDTDVPPVMGRYEFDVEGRDRVVIDMFHGKRRKDGDDGPDIISKTGRFATPFIWKSFVSNMQMGARGGSSGGATVEKIEKPKESIKDDRKPYSHEVAFSRLRRLPIFRLLSMGMIPKNRKCHILPSVPRETTQTVPSKRDCAATATTASQNNQTNNALCGSPSKSSGTSTTSSSSTTTTTTTTGSTISSLLREWNAVKDHFNKNNNSPHRNTRRGAKGEKQLQTQNTKTATSSSSSTNASAVQLLSTTTTTAKTTSTTASATTTTTLKAAVTTTPLLCHVIPSDYDKSNTSSLNENLERSSKSWRRMLD